MIVEDACHCVEGRQSLLRVLGHTHLLSLVLMASSGVQSSKPPSKSYWKGKARATESDYDDLNQTITYRHLLSNNLGVRDPLRVIALCDSDAFYAACEQVRLNIDPSLPLVVLQWDSLIAVNYPARKFDISRMCKVWEAKKKCPNLVIVHVATLREGDTEPGYWENPDTHTHKVSLDHYRRESMKIIQLFKDGLPTGEVGEFLFGLCGGSRDLSYASVQRRRR